MKFFVEGDCGKALCHSCGGLVKTLYRRLDVQFSDGKGSAPNILVAVCVQCDGVVAVPAQSTPAIREARQKTVTPLEANLPAVYLDMLDLAAYTVDKDVSTDFRRILLSYFVHRTAQDKKMWPMVATHYEQARAAYPEKRGVLRRRLSMKMPARMNADLVLLQAQSQLNISAVIKSVVFDIQASIIEKPTPSLLKELRHYAAVMG